MPPARRHPRPVRRGAAQRVRRPRGVARGASPEAGRGPHPRGRAQRARGRRRGARPHARLQRTRAPGRMDRLQRQGHHRRGQPGHRRLGPGPADGHRGPEALPGAAAPALRQQRGRHPPGGDPEGPRPRDDALPGGLQDLHHPGDAHQRPQRPALVPRARPPRRARGPALRRHVHQHRSGHGLRHRSPKHVPLLGLGGRPLLALVGHRVAHRAGRGLQPLPRTARRRGGHGPAPARDPLRGEPARHHGPAGHLVPQLFRRREPCRAALRPVPAPLPRLAAADRHGVQRQAHRPQRPAGELRHRAHHLGRAGHQRPARLLPAPAPGHHPGALRLHRPGHQPQPHRRPPRQAAGQLLRAKRGADERQDRPGGAPGTRGRGPRSGRHRAAAALQGLRGQPPLLHPARAPPGPAHPGQPGGALRAQDLRAGRALERLLLRPMGRAARQATGRPHPARNRRRHARHGPRRLHQRTDPSPPSAGLRPKAPPRPPKPSPPATARPRPGPPTT
jgi:hypothetical protein